VSGLGQIAVLPRHLCQNCKRAPELNQRMLRAGDLGATA